MTFIAALCLFLAASPSLPLPVGRTYSASVPTPPRAQKRVVTAAHFNTAGLTCQVHHTPLRAVDVPIGYGHYFVVDLDGSVGAETTARDLAAAVLFPNTVSPINTGFCVPGPNDPTSRVQLVCDQCIHDEGQWLRTRALSKRPAPTPIRR